MPRNAPRTRTQPPQAAAGQAYGERKAQMQAQEAIPLPRAPQPGRPPEGGHPPVPGPAPAGDHPAAPPADPMAAALSMAPPDPPPWQQGPVDEPITAGLPYGPGPGPEALNRRPPPTPVADLLLRFAHITGDTSFVDAAQQIAATVRR